jgi:hypothetical protein
MGKLKQFLSDFVSLLFPLADNGQLHDWWTICGVIAFLLVMSLIFYWFG